jgi:hypothetical protein
MPTRLLLIAAVLALAAAACGGTDEPQSSAPPAPPAAGPINLKGICPDPVIVQTNWFPQSEHGAVYQLVGSGYKIDAAHKRVTGPLMVNGNSTGCGSRSGPAAQRSAFSPWRR